MSVVKGRRGIRIPVVDSVAERRARLERVAAAVVLVAALVTIGLIGVLVMQVRGVL
jgi:hypothetical protein